MPSFSIRGLIILGFGICGREILEPISCGHRNTPVWMSRRPRSQRLPLRLTNWCVAVTGSHNCCGCCSCPSAQDLSRVDACAVLNKLLLLGPFKEGGNLRPPAGKASGRKVWHHHSWAGPAQSAWWPCLFPTKAKWKQSGFAGKSASAIWLQNGSNHSTVQEEKK